MHVVRVVRMIQGRWKLPILFRLFADRTTRSSLLLRDLPGVSQKMLTQHLRELEQDGLIVRIDYHEKPLRVEYRISEAGLRLMPVLFEATRFSTASPRPPTERPGKRLAFVAIPEKARRVIVFADRGLAAERLLAKARDHLTANGRELVAQVPERHDDWNDAWRARLDEEARGPHATAHETGSLEQHKG